MSQENVEAVRAVYEEWAKGNFRAGADLYDPLVLFIPIPEFPAAEHYLGKEGVRDFMLHFLGAWTSLTIEAEELTEAGDNVVVTARWRGIGKGARSHRKAGLRRVDVPRPKGSSSKHRLKPSKPWGCRSKTLTPTPEPAGYCGAMSQENAETVRRWQAAMSASSEETLAAIAEFFDPDVDYYPVRKWPEAQPCQGREEFSQFIAGFQDAFSRDEWAIQDLIEVGDDRVFVCVSMRTEGRGSGVKLEGDLYQCFWLRHGHFFRIEDHLTLEGALHGLGLEGETLEAAGLKE